jgi:hypothetical protein
MVCKPVIFEGQTYKSKSQFKNYCANLINNVIGECLDVKTKYPSEYEILIKILERNPTFTDEIKQNMNTIQIRNNAYGNGLECNIIKEDGSEVAISWHQAIDGKSKSSKEELICALRTSINPQILQYKHDNTNECVICQKKGKVHIDHYKPQFKKLSEDFIHSMESKGVSIPNNFRNIDDRTNRRCFLETDNTFASKWNDYHRTNAELRILCESCNLSRSKTK